MRTTFNKEAKELKGLDTTLYSCTQHAAPCFGCELAVRRPDKGASDGFYKSTPMEGAV